MCVWERLRKRDGGIEDCGGMREYRVRARGQACSVSRWMKNWSRGKSFRFFFLQHRGRNRKKVEKSVWGGMKKKSISVAFFDSALISEFLKTCDCINMLSFFPSLFSPDIFSSQSQIFGLLFSSAFLSFAWGSVCSRQVHRFFFLSLCLIFPPRIISAWSQGQLFTSPFAVWTFLPLSLFGWLLVLFYES